MRRLKYYPFLLMLSAILLSVIGLQLIGSAETSVVNRQLGGMILGIIVMLIAAHVDYRVYFRTGWFLYAGAVGLLLVVELSGSISGGSERWIDMGFIRFQPSELSKILLILFFAWFFSKYQERMEQVRFLLGSLVLAVIPIALILMQPDLSTGIIVTWMFLWILFLAELPWGMILKAVGVAVPVAGILLYLVTRPNQNIISEYQYRRIMAWISPEEWSQDAYQQSNSITAIASGQLWGKGLNNTSSLSVQNGGHIPEEHTDFIMAVAGEELGFVGCAVILLLLLCLVLECVRIGMRSAQKEERILCGGMAALIGGQAAVNIGVVTGLLPNTGVTLPFVSYGLTSLVSMFLGVGIVANIGIRRGNQKKGLNFSN